MPDITFQVTFHESGFSYDDYPIELAWTLRTTSTAGGAVSRTSGTDKRPRYVKEFLLFLGLFLHLPHENNNLLTNDIQFQRIS